MDEISLYKLDISILAMFIDNPNCPKEIFRILYNDPKKEYYTALARCENTPEEYLRLIYDSVDDQVYMSYLNNLSKNPKLPRSIFDRMYNDYINSRYNSYVGVLLSANPKTPDYILREIYKKTDDYEVLRNLAKNPNTPKEVLDKLQHTANNNIKFNLLSNPNRLSNLEVEEFELLSPDLQLYIVKNPEISEEILYSLASRINKNSTDSIKYAKAIIENPKTSLITINYLMSYKFFREHLFTTYIKNPKVPIEDIINSYKEDREGVVKELIKREPNIEDVLTKIIYYSSSKEYTFNNFTKETSLIAKHIIHFYFEEQVYTFMKALNNKVYFKELGIEWFNDNYDMAYYYILAKKYISQLSNGKNTKNTKELIKQLDEEIKGGIIPNDILYFFHGYPSFCNLLSYESVQRIRKVYAEANNEIEYNGLRIKYKELYLLKIKHNLLKALKDETKKGDITTQDWKNIIPRLKDVSLNFDDLNYDSSFVALFKGSQKSKAQINFSSLNFLKEKSKNNKIEFGYYPQDTLVPAEIAVLDLLLETGLIKPSNKKFTFYGRLFGSKEYYIYELNDRMFIKTSEIGWVEVKPIVWEIDYENNTLTSEKTILSFYKSDYTLIKDTFFNDAITQFAPNPRDLNQGTDDQKIDEEQILSDLEKMNSQVQQDRAEQLRKEKEYAELTEKIIKIREEKQKLEQQEKELLEARNNLGVDKDSTQDNYTSNLTTFKRVTVNMDYLLKRVDEHYEFDDKYKDHLKNIDLSLIIYKNIKLSDLDLRNTNLVLDPQKIYKKDLSGSKVDTSIFYGLSISFAGCDLRGTVFEGNTDATGFEDAIIDDNTVLPGNVVIERKNNTL